MLTNAWLIPLFPLIAFVLLIVFGRRLKEISANVGQLATFVACVLALGAFMNLMSTGQPVEASISWLTLGDADIRMGFYVDELNALMLVIVSLVSFLVHVYSRGYMSGDERIGIFYAYLSLFTFSMLGLVISPNVLELYIFWELVGLCSFLLIGFWYEKPEAKAAAKKAFIVTRIGDVGLLVAILLLFREVGSFQYGDIFDAVDSGTVSPGMISLIATLMFVGAVGKSGQFPLHTWLPDAMEGPTPVSALIHAATMVAAGVYLVARVFPFVSASPFALDVVAYVGAFTAVFAASIALVQNDIKRVLAYSTVSQLGYMMFALGSAGYVAGVFHLTTHAFFKALLFLAAGAVIYTLGGEQDIRKMGGLWRTNKGTGALFLIGCLAIAGIPPFSGYFSKEEVLAAAIADGRFGVAAIGIVAAFFTAFYMFRLFFLVFFGQRDAQSERARTVPLVMTAPMWILAFLSIAAGFIHTPWYGGLGHLLGTGAGDAAFAGQTAGPLWLPVVTVIVALAGIGLAYGMYAKGQIDADRWRKSLPWAHRVLLNKYYIDELYAYGIVTPVRTIGYVLQAFDRYVVSGIVSLAAALSVAIGRRGSRVQNGQVQTYGLITAIGAVLLIIGLTVGGVIG